ncbi:MAG: hypothetical protein Q7T82_10095 [Armatimonadota bacterium]|nr:hypothetical protein [Armatimonadota bacterium]
MEQKVMDILRESFPGIELDIDVLPDGRISGSVVWEGFTGLDQVDRQDKLRSVLREKLGADAQQVGVLLTYTPDELRAMHAA